MRARPREGRAGGSGVDVELHAPRGGDAGGKEERWIPSDEKRLFLSVREE